MTSDVKGYVIRRTICDGTYSHTCASLGEVFAEWREMVALGALAIDIFRVHTDGREERLPSYEAALAENERISALFNAQTVDLGRANAEIVRQRAQVSALMDRVERESRVVFDAERARDEARAEIERLQGLIGAFAKRARLRSDADGWCNLVAELAPFEALQQESVAAGTAKKGGSR